LKILELSFYFKKKIVWLTFKTWIFCLKFSRYFLMEIYYPYFVIIQKWKRHKNYNLFIYLWVIYIIN